MSAAGNHIQKRSQPSVVKGFGPQIEFKICHFVGVPMMTGCHLA